MIKKCIALELSLVELTCRSYIIYYIVGYSSSLVLRGYYTTRMTREDHKLTVSLSSALAIRQTGRAAPMGVTDWA